MVAGIVTIFAIVAGCVGADLHPSKVVIIGIGNLLADAISMGFGEYVSSAAEEDFVKSERLREEWYADLLHHKHLLHQPCKKSPCLKIDLF